jgi:hypothetical protein
MTGGYLRNDWWDWCPGQDLNLCVGKPTFACLRDEAGTEAVRCHMATPLPLLRLSSLQLLGGLALINQSSDKVTERFVV